MEEDAQKIQGYFVSKILAEKAHWKSTEEHEYP